VLSDLGDQFDSGTYAKDPAAAVDAMPLLALEWARVGWGEALNGHLLEAARFLGSAFALDPSPVLALRCAAVHMKAGHNAEAKHMLALAAAFEGAEATEAAKQLTQLDSAGANGAIAAARAELSSMREFRFSNKNRDEGKAEVALAFDGSSSPQSVLYLRGSLNRSAFESPLKARSYSFTFPDNSSIKIVRKAQVNCSGTTCTVDFEPIGNVLP
jgi:hypothetical protein